MIDSAERAQFEKWVQDLWGLSTEEYDLDFYTGLREREYKDGRVQDFWIGWQAAYARGQNSMMPCEHGISCSLCVNEGRARQEQGKEKP